MKFDILDILEALAWVTVGGFLLLGIAGAYSLLT